MQRPFKNESFTNMLIQLELLAEFNLRLLTSHHNSDHSRTTKTPQISLPMWTAANFAPVIDAG